MSMRWSAAPVAALWMALWVGACSNEPPECTAGSDGCPCEAGGECDEGLVCTDGTCARPRELTLTVPSDARACEVLLRDGEAEVASVVFDGAAGAHVREEPLTSISFSATTDSAIAAHAVRVQVVGDGDPTIERSRCFDAAGDELSGASVRIGG